MLKSLNILLFLFISSLVSFAQTKQIDLLIEAAGIYVGGIQNKTTTGMAINKGKIVETGIYNDLANKYKAAKTIHEPKKYIYPGFIDAHCHFSGYALDQYKVNLVGTTSFQQVLEKVVAYEKTNKLSWVYGRGWDQNDWEKKTFPNKTDLDKAFPDKPVILKRIDGHAVLVNQKALDMAGITSATKIDGGIIEIKNGALTGILIDNATEPVEKLIPSLPEKVSIYYLQSAEKECYSLGLTGVVDCGITYPIIELMQKLYKDQKLSINYTALLSQDSLTIGLYVANGPIIENNFRLTGIKIYADGALGSRGACLLKDYHDMQGHKGMLLTSSDYINSICRYALRHNWQVCTHAIGDSANRAMLHLYAKFLDGKNDKRWRIEHAQVVNPGDHYLFGKYSIIPSVQPTHAISDMPWAETRLGKNRIDHAYSYRALLKQNNWIALGTDFPVEAIDPLATFYTAVARKDNKGNPQNGFLKENGLSREEALKGITIWAAKSVFMEKEKGSLEVGKDADLVILDQDIMTIEEKEILKTKVFMTITAGEIRYQQ